MSALGSPKRRSIGRSKGFTMGSVEALGGAAPQIYGGASPPMPPSSKMANLFNTIDSAGSGTISKSQFEQAFQTLNPPAAFKKAGAEAVWTKLDPTGSGSVGKSAFVDAMTAQMSQLRQGAAANRLAALPPASATLTASLYTFNGLTSGSTSALGGSVDAQA